MSEPRTIQRGDQAIVNLLIDGEEVPRSAEILAVNVVHEFNRISSATIVMADGESAAEDFELSSGELFVPGNEVDIQFGFTNEEPTSLFKGIIVKQKIKSRANKASLEITCKHKTFRMATSEKYAVFEESSDSDIIETIANNYGVTPDVEGSSITHQNMVQYRSTDWDFVVNRAEANGQVVITNQDQLKTSKPEVKSDADIELLFGATILDFEAQIDARLQEQKLIAKAWDYSNAEKIESEAEEGDLATIGNLNSEDLATGAEINEEYTHLTGLHTQEETDAAAIAEQTRRRLSKIRGTVTCQGTAQIATGGTVKLGGLGDRFNGNALVSGVVHSFKNGTWTTKLQVGMNPKSHLEKFKPVPKSSHFIPRVQGLEIGVVTSLDDPDGDFRVQVKLPVFDDETGVWARVAQPDAGNERTIFFRPEIDDEVVVGFLNDDPRAPVILGMLHSSNYPSPIEQNEDNHEKGIITRDGLKVLFNDDLKEIVIETDSGNKITLSEDSGSIVIEDENDNKISLDSGGIIMETQADINIKSSGDVKIEGTNVEISATAQATVSGSAGAELSSSAATKVEGSIVQIN